MSRRCADTDTAVCRSRLCWHLQVLYAIKTRNGEVYMKFQKMYGDRTAFQVWSMQHFCETTAASARQGAAPDQRAQLCSGPCHWKHHRQPAAKMQQSATCHELPQSNPNRTR